MDLERTSAETETTGERCNNNGIPRRVHALLLSLTLAYLLLETAFNARLVDVLGAFDPRLASSEAISGLEFWGRYISSLAVGLAIGTVHVGQYYSARRPFPLNLADRARRSWQRRDFQISFTVILAVMIATFFAERALVDRRAEDAAPATLWWAHYGARASDLAGIGLNQVRTDKALRKPFEEFIQGYAKEKHVPAMSVGNLDQADAKTFVAIFAHSSQNWARLKPRSDSDSRPFTPGEIQNHLQSGIKDALRDSSSTDSRNAILVPVRRCFEIAYDQSPPFETEAPAFPLPTSRCLVATADMNKVRTSYPALAQADLEACFRGPAGAPKAFADFSALKCAYDTAASGAMATANVASAVYDEVYAQVRRTAVSRVAADPSLLTAADHDRLRQELRNDFDRATTARTYFEKDDLFNPATDALPACGRLESARVQAFARYYSYAASENYLRGREQDHCDRFNSILPLEPDPDYTAALNKYAPDFNALLNKRLLEVNIEAIDHGALKTRDQFWQSMIDRKTQPVEAATRAILTAQFGGDASSDEEIPSVRTIDSLDSFFSNPVVSRLASNRLEELSDSAFMCMGLTGKEGTIAMSGTLADISSNWDSAFHQQATAFVESKGVASRFSGVVEDFQKGGRCRQAGLAAYHRSTMPGTSLVISMLGLLFHGAKAIYYLLALFALALPVRLGLAFASMAGAALLPFASVSPILQQPVTGELLGAYRTSHGAIFSRGVDWLIRAELALYPMSARVRDNLFSPWGITFDSHVSQTEFNARVGQVKRACGRVPQIAQSREFQTLQSFLTNRSLCEPAD